MKAKLLDVLRRESAGWTGLDVLIELREAMHEFPQTKVQFAPRSQLPDEVVPFLYQEELLLLLGTWPVPDRFHTGRRETYVNPTGVHARRYADVVGECECGAVMVHKHDMPDERLASRSHDESCTTAYRSAARDDLEQQRREWIELATSYWLSDVQTSRRMGVEPGAVRPLCYRLDVSWDELRREGRDDIYAVWGELRDEYTSQEIATAFGVSASGVRTATM